MARPVGTPLWLRWEINSSTESIAALSKQYGLNPKTVAKWKKRKTFNDKKSGPREGAFRRLKTDEERLAVAFKVYSRLPLDDCLEGLKGVLPSMSRSSYYRCLARHRVTRLPKLEQSCEEYSKEKTVYTVVGDLVEIPAGYKEIYLMIFTEGRSKAIFIEFLTINNISQIVDAFGRIIEKMPFRPSLVVVNSAGLLVPKAHFDYDMKRDPIIVLAETYDIKISAIYNGLRLHRLELASALEHWFEQHLQDCSIAAIRAYIENAAQKYNELSRPKSLGYKSPSAYLDGLLKLSTAEGRRASAPSKILREGRAKKS